MKKMKKIIAVMVAAFCMSTLSAKQCVKYLRYNFSLNVAQSTSSDLEKFISSGNKIISFSLDYKKKCMVVVYDDGR